MQSQPALVLKPRVTPGGRVQQTGTHSWRLEIMADARRAQTGRFTRYHLAQLDDYQGLARRNFPWQPPLELSLKARVSRAHIPGTWGFGLWNDPFGLAFVRGGGLRLPVLPNAAWFFFASPENYLSLEDELPANGAMATTFSSPSRLPLAATWLIPFLPWILIPSLARWMRRQARNFIRQDGARILLEATAWHQYRLKWMPDCVIFSLDGEVLLETPIVPPGPLGLVIWIDNQFAAYTPEGRLRYGTLPVGEREWIEIAGVRIK